VLSAFETRQKIEDEVKYDASLHYLARIQLRFPSSPTNDHVRSTLPGKAGRDTTNISLPRFRSGCRGEGPFTSVPVFVGVDSVSVRKQLNIARIIRQARDRLLQLYKASFQ
jgi:hypothetical protein